MNPTEKIKEFPDIRVLNFINLLFSHPTSNKYGDNLSSLPKRNMKEKLPTYPTYKFKLCISSRIFHFFAGETFIGTGGNRDKIYEFFIFLLSI